MTWLPWFGAFVLGFVGMKVLLTAHMERGRAGHWSAVGLITVCAGVALIVLGALLWRGA